MLSIQPRSATLHLPAFMGYFLTHLLFTDIVMPGEMNGLELAHHARTHWPWIAQLITSGRGAPALNTFPVGSRFLQKPYEIDNVVAHVRALTAG